MDISSVLVFVVKQDRSTGPSIATHQPHDPLTTRNAFNLVKCESDSTVALLIGNHLIWLHMTRNNRNARLKSRPR